MVRLGNMFNLEFELPGFRLVSTSEVVDRKGTYFGAELEAFRLQCHFLFIYLNSMFWYLGICKMIHLP